MNQPLPTASEVFRPEQLAGMAGLSSASSGDDDLSQYLPHLDRMSAQLTQTSSQIESSVLMVCQSFQEIAVRAKATVAMGRTFVSGADDDHHGQAEGSFDTLLKRCGHTLVHVLNITELSTEVSRRAVERVKQIERASRKITGALDQLNEITKGNRIMALNARIEAAHAGERGAGFAVVAVEVAAQSERSQQVTSQISGFVEELRALAVSTLTDLEQTIQRDQAQVERCRIEVQESLDELQSSHRRMKQVLDSISRDGEVLANDIGIAVRGMQFQDRVSQRIAHVVHDLSVLRSQLAARTAEDGGTGQCGAENFAAYTMREERLVAGSTEAESAEGDVELF